MIEEPEGPLFEHDYRFDIAPYEYLLSGSRLRRRPLTLTHYDSRLRSTERRGESLNTNDSSFLIAGLQRLPWRGSKIRRDQFVSIHVVSAKVREILISNAGGYDRLVTVGKWKYMVFPEYLIRVPAETSSNASPRFLHSLQEYVRGSRILHILLYKKD
jgi:hypothetical protein